LVRFLIALVAGFLLNLSFNESRWFFSIIAIAILIQLLSTSNRKNRIKIISIFSFVFFAAHLSWMRVLGNDAWLLLVLISAIPWLLAAYLPINKVKLSSLFIFAAVIVVVETIKSHVPWGGFPWGLIGYAQVDGPIVKLASLGGVALVTFATVIIAGLVLRMFSKRVFGSALFLLIIFTSLFFIDKTNSSELFPIVAIQGNVPRIGLELSAQRSAVLNNHLNLTREYLAREESIKPKLIVWPESSTDIDPLTNIYVANEINELVKSAQVPILVGATTWNENPTGPRNTGILWNTDSTKEFYVKNQLVPFGEYVPYRNVLTRYIKRFELVPNDYVAGNELGLFQVDDIVFGNVICFEVAYGTYVRQLVNAGAQFITIQTNNATYGNTKQPEQQFQISRFRAIEHKRSVLVASTSGISGAIGPNAEVFSKTEQFKPAVVEVELPIVSAISFSDRYPRWAALVSFFIVFIALAKTYRRGRAHRLTQ